MSIKEKTIEQLESKIEDIERFIAENGVGSRYLSKIEQVQRDINLGLAITGVIGLAGLSAWVLMRGTE